MYFARPFLVTCLSMPAFAGDGGRQTENDYNVTVLVSNVADTAPVTDPLLVNAWGIAAGPTGPWWVANNGSESSTLYGGAGVKSALEVAVPGAPTGTVFNGSAQFELAPGAPALFLFASEDGSISGWNPTVDQMHAAVVSSDPDSIYKGLAIHGGLLYASDFGECEVVAFDTKFARAETSGGFEDDSIPDGYCPFGIQAIGDSIFVTYALREEEDDVAGRGHGFVRQFDADGNLVAKVASHGALNSPWGMAMAPEDFGRFSGCLIVGNFGDGRLNAYCRHTDGRFKYRGALREDGQKVVIEGLWGIGFGNGQQSGPTNVLYFAAGPDEEEHGAFGKIEAAGSDDEDEADSAQ